MSKERFEVALSFSGKDREFAERLKTALNEIGLRVFYDQDFQSELLGVELTEALESVYRDQCQLCVIICSANYLTTDWGRLEKRSALEKALIKDEHIIPIVLDDTRIPGIRSTVGYLDARRKSIYEIADLIAMKILKDRTSSDIDVSFLDSIDKSPIFLGSPNISNSNPLAQAHLSLAVRRVATTARTICREEGLLDGEKLDLGTLLYRNPSEKLMDCIKAESYQGGTYSLQVSLISGLEVITHPEIPCKTPIEQVWRGSPLEKLLDKKYSWSIGNTVSPPDSFFSWVDFVRSGIFHSKAVRYNIGLIKQCMSANWSIHEHGIVYVFAEAHIQ
jgi:hypothetical protein